MMRLRRICSTEELFDFRMDQLKNHLLSRGYNMGILEKARERIGQVSREKALERVEREKIQRQCFVTEYHPSLPEMGRIIRKHWSVMIERDGRLKECFPRPSMTAYRRGKSLKELLCRARMPNKERRSVRQAERQGFYSCGWPLCNLCPFAVNAKEHLVSGRKFNINGRITCTTTGCVYKIRCKKCPGFVYYGETGRMQNTSICLVMV